MPGVLTKKQSWRRQSNCPRRRQHDLIYKEGFAKGDMKIGTGPRSLSDQSFREGPPLLHSNSKPWGTTGNLQDHKHDLFGNKLKSVMFSARVHIILIPSISEYEAAGLAKELWWEDDDYKDFKQSALQEVKDYMSQKNIQDSKEAIKILYQKMDGDDLEKIASQQQNCPSSSGATSSSSPSSEMKLESGSELSTNTIQEQIEQEQQLSEKIKKEEEDDEVYYPGSRLVKLLKRSQSFCVATLSTPKRTAALLPQPPRKQQPTTIQLPFRSKTDVDILHDKGDSPGYHEFLKRLKKLHHERTNNNNSNNNNKSDAQTLSEENNSESEEDCHNNNEINKQAIHPLALICSN